MNRQKLFTDDLKNNYYHTNNASISMNNSTLNLITKANDDR